MQRIRSVNQSERVNTHEALLNTKLASLLRSRGSEAHAMQQALSTGSNTAHRIDILVELEDRSVAIEAEFEPGRKVQTEAEGRLIDPPLQWRGLPVLDAFKLIYPRSIKSVPIGGAMEALSESEGLRFARGTLRDARVAWESWERGSGVALAETLHHQWVRTATVKDIDMIVSKAGEAIQMANSILERVPKFSASGPETNIGATAPLIWLNAMLFQDLLAARPLPEVSTGKNGTISVPPLDPAATPSLLIEQWREILAINWWPVFHIARESLKITPASHGARAVRVLVSAARDIAETGVVRQHDVAGRIFHRLLDSRKFLATNYTTIPAAMLLAGLAFDDRVPKWREVNWPQVGRHNLRVVDPACGSGTLLMAAVQEIRKRFRRAGAANLSDATRDLLEESVHGYDVVPAAVHLTAATLSMAETSQVIHDMPICLMPHGVVNGVARLGALDFLPNAPGYKGVQQAYMFQELLPSPERVDGSGETHRQAQFPMADLFISNPPYTRAGGPGDAENTDWNPLFGSLLSRQDAAAMQKALGKTLKGTAGSSYAGLGSAFVVLADERLEPGGRMAFVLPATLLTGSRWKPVRKLLLEHFRIDWVVVSHDARHRAHRATLPGRRWVSFSESTRIAEALVVGSKIGAPEDTEGWTRFVNLRRNPDQPTEALALVRTLLAVEESKDQRIQELRLGNTVWGEIEFVRQQDLAPTRWLNGTFVQGRLTRTATELVRTSLLKTPSMTAEIPLCKVAELCELGPYEMQVKNPSQGCFEIVATDDPSRSGHPALWHHKSGRMRRLVSSANARLTPRPDRDSDLQSSLLKQAGRLHLARDLGHAPQRLAAVLTDEPMLGTSSWITMLPNDPRPGGEEALCLWLNSTVGLLLRIVGANRPYLGRSRMPHEVAREMLVLDVGRLTSGQLAAAKAACEELDRSDLLGFAHIYDDPQRRRLDQILWSEVLGIDHADEVARLAKALQLEPLMTARH